MALVEKGYGLTYEAHRMGLIKVGKAGTLENGNAYKASVKVKCTNLNNEYDEELGDVEREDIIEFKIPCESNVQAGELNRLLRVVKASGVVIPLNGDLPRRYEGNPVATVTVTDSAKDLIEKFKNIKPKKPE